MGWANKAFHKKGRRSRFHLHQPYFIQLFRLQLMPGGTKCLRAFLKVVNTLGKSIGHKSCIEGEFGGQKL